MIAYNSAVKMLVLSASLEILVISLETAAEDTLLPSFYITCNYGL